MKTLIKIVGLLLLAFSPLSLAYIGPGSGISVVGSLLGLLGTIVLVFGAVLLWPFRRMLKKRNAEDAEEAIADGDEGLESEIAPLAASEAKQNPGK